jgi:hypothetical protein
LGAAAAQRRDLPIVKHAKPLLVPVETPEAMVSINQYQQEHGHDNTATPARFTKPNEAKAKPLAFRGTVPRHTLVAYGLIGQTLFGRVSHFAWLWPLISFLDPTHGLAVPVPPIVGASSARSISANMEA